MSAYTLDNGEELHRESPETFQLPSAEQRHTLQPGALVKLVFRGTDAAGAVRVERMWVQVTEKGDGYSGTLDNDPYHIVGLAHGDTVAFGPEHVIQIDG
ncbi:MAG: DUF2314 domain-containing protein [Propionibacteriaceae bacterium]|nr:DUF2314 domain-containing protein [Propionibacteriaceae bacterium]